MRIVGNVHGSLIYLYANIPRAAWPPHTVFWPPGCGSKRQIEAVHQGDFMFETTPAAGTSDDPSAAAGRVLDVAALDTLGRMIDTFVMATVETLCAADRAAPELRHSDFHRNRVEKVMADLEEVEATVGRLRAMWAVESGRLAPMAGGRSAADGLST